MIDSGCKKVVFRIAGIGFSLAVDSLLEVRESADVDIDRSAADVKGGLLGLIPFRGDAIPLRDVRGLFGLPAADDDPVVIVVLGTDGPWGVPAERIDGVAPGEEFRAFEAPALLNRRDRRPFDAIDLWSDELLVSFEPTRIEPLQVPA